MNQGLREGKPLGQASNAGCKEGQSWGKLANVCAQSSVLNGGNYLSCPLHKIPFSIKSKTEIGKQPFTTRELISKDCNKGGKKKKKVCTLTHTNNNHQLGCVVTKVSCKSILCLASPCLNHSGIHKWRLYNNISMLTTALKFNQTLPAQYSQCALEAAYSPIICVHQCLYGLDHRRPGSQLSHG